MFKSIKARCALFSLLLFVTCPINSLKASDLALQEESHWLGKACLAIATPFIVYGVLYYKHARALHALESRIDRSTLSATAKNNQFLCASWRSHAENTPNGRAWEEPSDVWHVRSLVTKAFLNDATEFEDRVYLYSPEGIRYLPSSLKNMDASNTRSIITQAIAFEKAWFEEQMAYVAQFTDVPELLVQELNPLESRNLKPYELSFGCAIPLKEMDAVKLNELIKKLNVHIESAQPIKSVLHGTSWLPTTWSFAPCYQDASRVYLKLFVLYARLCALDAAWLAH